MTNEEAIKIIRKYECNKEHYEACEMAVKALKQEDILDEIVTEIIQVANQEKVHDEKWALGLKYALNIIDKYKMEGRNE